MAVRDLQPLNEIFRIREVAGAEFRIDRAGPDQLPQLLFTHRSHGSHVERFSGKDEPIAECDDFISELDVPRDGTQLDQRLPFVGPRGSVRRKIRGERIERDGQAAGPSVRSQAKINLKNPLLTRTNGVRERLDQPLIELGRPDHLGSACRTGIVVNEHQLDV